MAKGISLEQLKVELDTEAQQKCAKQNNTIKSLNNKIQSLLEILIKKENSINALQNRCFALSKMELCLFCEFKENCSALKTFWKGAK